MFTETAAATPVEWVLGLAFRESSAFSSRPGLLECRIQTMEETKPYSRENAFQDMPTIGVSEAALWGRLLDPLGTELSSEAARYILNLRFPQSDLDRMRDLAEKAREGNLTLEEHIEPSRSTLRWITMSGWATYCR